MTVVSDLGTTVLANFYETAMSEDETLTGTVTFVGHTIINETMDLSDFVGLKPHRTISETVSAVQAQANVNEFDITSSFSVEDHVKGEKVDYKVVFTWREELEGVDQYDVAIEFKENGGEWTSLTVEEAKAKGVPGTLLTAPNSVVHGSTTVQRTYQDNIGISNADENGSFEHYEPVPGETINVYSAAVTERKTPDGDVKVTIRYLLNETNYEVDLLAKVGELYLSTIEESIAAYKVGDEVSLVNIQAISDEIGSFAEENVTFELEEDENLIRFRELVSNYTRIVSFYQEMTKGIRASVTVKDEAIRIAWLKEFERFTKQVSIMRRVIVDITGVFQLNNHFNITTWRKIKSIMGKFTTKVESSLDSIFAEKVNQSFVDETVAHIQGLKKSYKDLVEMSSGTKIGLTDLVAKADKSGVQVSEAAEMQEILTYMGTKVDTLNAKLCAFIADADKNGVKIKIAAGTKTTPSP